MNTANTKNKASKTLIILLAVGAIAVVGSIGYAQFSKLTNGLENYTGAQLDAALSAIETEQKLAQRADKPNFFEDQTKLHIDSVTPAPAKTTAQGQQLPCKSSNNNGNDGRYYYVHISYRWLFGITYRTKDYWLCGRPDNI